MHRARKHCIGFQRSHYRQSISTHQCGLVTPFGGCKPPCSGAYSQKMIPANHLVSESYGVSVMM